MSLEDRAKAAAKEAEGKLHAAAGELTEDNVDKAAGEAKQAEAKAEQKRGEAKDKLKSKID